MKDGWKSIKLKEITSVITKGTTPKSYEPSSVNSVNFIKAECITRYGTIDESKFSAISILTHDKLKRSQLEEQDILMSMAGAILGKVGLVENHHLPANTNQALALIRITKAKAVPMFVKLYLQQETMYNFINSSTAQSAQPNINLAEIGDLEINLPPIATQQKIATILSAFDEKIELNRQMNKTLEEMAQTLFREMCIPKSDELEEGWEWKTLGEIADIITGFPFKSAEYSFDEGIRVVRGENVSVDFLRWDTEKKWNNPSAQYSKYFLEPWDIVIGMDGSRVGLNKTLVFPNQLPLLLAQRVARVRAKDSTFISFIKLAVVGSSFGQYVDSIKTGTSIPHISLSQIKEYRILIPPLKAIKQLNDTVKGFYETIGQNLEEIKVLGESRDLLLPRLLNGEIDIE